jgi:hypothetical protein
MVWEIEFEVVSGAGFYLPARIAVGIDTGCD